MVDYHPSASNLQKNIHKHELITTNGSDLNNESEKFRSNLDSESDLSTSTNNIVTKARKLLPIHDDLNTAKLNPNISGEFTVYKSVSSFNLSSSTSANKPHNNIDIFMPNSGTQVIRSLPKVSLVRNATQQNLNPISTTPTNINYNMNHVTQLPAIKVAGNVPGPIILNTHSFASAPSKSINISSEPSNYLFFFNIGLYR